MSEYIPKNNLDSNLESDLDIENSIDNEELNNISKNEPEELDLQNDSRKEIELKIEEVRADLDKLEAELKADEEHKKLKEDYLNDKITYEELSKSVVDIYNSYPNEILKEKSIKFINSHEIRDKNIENEQEVYKKLKQDFLYDKIDYKQVYEVLINLDQKIQDRQLSIENIKFLEDPEIKAKYLENKEDITQISEYYSELSFAYWHAAQYKLFNEEGIEKEAISLIETDLDYREKSVLANPEAYIGAEDRDYYALATIAYLKKDLDELENIYSKMTQDENHPTFCNTQIVERFVKGLKERGKIDYKKDYQDL